MLDQDETIKDLASFSQDYHSHLASSVSLAIVQRYLNHVLDAVLSQNIHIRAVAIDVLSFTNKQGLAHPLQVRRDDGRLYRTTLMFIESVETSSGTAIGNRASVLHAILQGKRAFYPNTMYTVSPRHPLIIRRKSLSTQYKVAKTYHLY